MLDRWERRVTHDVLAQVEREGGNPRKRTVRAGALTFGDEILPVELAVRDWSRRDPAVAQRVRRVDNIRMAYLRKQFRTVCEDEDDLEARCTLAFGFAIGTHFMTPDHHERSPSDVLRRVIAVLWPA